MLTKFLTRLFKLKDGELPALGYSFLYFFTLLSSYYIIRPLRDEMGVAGGVENLQWLFSGTFIVMLAAIPLYGWVSSRYPRQRFLPYVYFFFIVCLIGFYLLFQLGVEKVYIARIFFIWVSVFNLFVVSVFWSFMNDIYDNEQAKRLFAIIAAGGTLGAIVGPAVTTTLALIIPTQQLILLSALLLFGAVVCIKRLIVWQRDELRQPTFPTDKIQETENHHNDALGGRVIDGIVQVVSSPYLLGIGAMILLFTTLATFLYIQQAELVKGAFADSGERTALFAFIDLLVNTLTLTLQLFITARLIRGIGLQWTICVVPLLIALGFTALALQPTLAILIVVQVIRRAGNYAIMRPARETLYVVLRREEKYKAKNVIDTVIYRGGDALSSWVYSGLRASGMGMQLVAATAIPLALLLAVLGYFLGKKQIQLAAPSANPVKPQ